MDDDLKKIFLQSSSVSFMSGKRDSGKTDFAFRIGEDLIEEKLFMKFAGNIHLKEPDPRFKEIFYHDEVEVWLREKGRKLFLIDELGKHLFKMAFMSKKTRLILELCQLARKFDAHVLGIAPSENLINKLFKDTDILDIHMKKLSKKIVEVRDYTQFDVYRITDIPRTTIPFITKDIADYELTNPNKRGKLSSLTSAEQAAILYCHWRNLRKVGQVMNISHEAVRKMLNRWVESRKISLSTVNLDRVEVKPVAA